MKRALGKVNEGSLEVNEGKLGFKEASLEQRGFREPNPNPNLGLS